MDRTLTVAELQARADVIRARGERIALVPTMGALHAGHLALVAEGRRLADHVWVTIFVNPTQFDDPQDLAGYPRTTESDLAACADAGVDLVFTPSAGEMYPYRAGEATRVTVAGLTDPLCGASRPGHFDGVTTVVTKLLLAARPHVAIFGEKDFQQLAVIRRMARDLLFGVEIVGVPTVREADGLALSSRNQNLDAEARRQALVLVRGLDAAQAAVAAGERHGARLVALARQEIEKAPRAEIDYVELRDPETLVPVQGRLHRDAVLALAVFVNPPEGQERPTVRLIDNRVLRP